ncbi:kinase-like protein [Lojkania enalia]|uniref:non-specific serine/threonine protein kinase n=1 Tax=Lojkania enalia TaxID=147567 RepID=A0A9P4KJ30_9PLEO|nr:kinase-like protein [Didymosphaeria enalia]
MASRSGLRWEKVLFGVEPRWTHEPDIEAVQRIASKALARACSVSFFCQGAFNKLYHVQCEQNARQSSYLMRVSLPVDPKFKTLSEVATLVWIQQHTSLPVPKIVAYDCSHANTLGFEWILMEKMPGRPLADVWRSMTWARKEKLVAKVAHYSAELFSKLFRCNSFGGDHFTYDVSRGPFNLSAEWLRARLQFNQLDCEKTIRESNDEDDIEEAEKTLAVVKRLIKAVGLMFVDDSKVSTVLLHDDLSQHNILVDDDGELQGIIDWECTSAVPPWKAAQFPQFLEGSRRERKPMREAYSANERGENLFQIHLLEYEQTKLRGVLIRTMKQANPDWVRMFRRSRKQIDFDIAIQNCDLHNLARKRINEWLDELERGKELTSLVTRLQ